MGTAHWSPTSAGFVVADLCSAGLSDRINEASGATATTDIAGIWANADLAMSFLAGDDAVQQVYLGPGGLVETAPCYAPFIEMS